MSDSQEIKFAIYEKGTGSYLYKALRPPEGGRKHEFVKDINEARLYSSRQTAAVAMKRVLTIPSPQSFIIPGGDPQTNVTLERYAFFYRFWNVVDSQKTYLSTEVLYFNGNRNELSRMVNLAGLGDFIGTRLRRSTDKVPDLEIVEVETTRRFTRR
jgi:hypothetical protein